MKIGGWQAVLLLSLAAVTLAAPARAMPVPTGRLPLWLGPRGDDVTTALLLEYYRVLPERRDGEDSKAWAARLEDGLKRFKADVSGRYTEAKRRYEEAISMTESIRATIASPKQRASFLIDSYELYTAYVDFLLSPFSKNELEEVTGLVDEAAEAVLSLIGEGLEVAQSRYNRSTSRGG